MADTSTSCASQPDPEAGDLRRRVVEGIFNMAAEAESLWYVFYSYADPGGGSPKLRSNVQASIDEQQPPIPEVILIPCDILDQEPAMRLVKDLVEELQEGEGEEEEEEEEDDEDEDVDTPAVIVVLFGGATDLVDASARRFRGAGAYDAIFYGSGKLMALMSEITDVLERFHQEQEQRMEQFRQHLFAEAAQSFPGFPPLEHGARTPPAVGAQIGPYGILAKLGKGTFGQVFSARNAETEEVEAVKAIPKAGYSSLKGIHRIWCEVMALRRISHPSHPSGVALRAVLHHRDFVYVVMDLAGMRTLSSAIRSGYMELPRARCCLQQIASAVAHCHKADVSHRDLKPENVMVDGERVRLVDFGSASLTCKVSNDICGTVPFMAPEVMGGEAYAPRAADVFSCGVLLFEMLCGRNAMTRLLQWSWRMAVPNPQCAEQYKQLASSPSAFHARVGEALQAPPPPELLALLSGAVEPNASLRWTAAQMTACQWLGAEAVVNGPACG